MYITTIPNRGSPPAILLRESYREGGRVKSRTLANLTHVPLEGVEALRAALKLKQRSARTPLGEGFEIVRTLPHGHVAPVLDTVRSLDGERLIDPVRSRRRNLVMAMIVAAIIAPASKLATARGLRSATSSSSLGEVCSVAGCDEDDLYEAMDWGWWSDSPPSSGGWPAGAFQVSPVRGARPGRDQPPRPAGRTADRVSQSEHDRAAAPPARVIAASDGARAGPDRGGHQA